MPKFAERKPDLRSNEKTFVDRSIAPSNRALIVIPDERSEIFKVNINMSWT